MRFRACIDEVSTLSKIVQTMEKLSKRCIFKMNETTVQIICLGETDVGVQIWSKIPVDSMFSDYRIQSNANNMISLEVSTEPLSQGLRSASAAQDVIVKLAKKNDQPVFSFEAQTESRQGKKMLVTHDVRITVMKAVEIEQIKEPLCPPPDLHIILPPLKELRTIVEHMQRLSDVVAISATPGGELVFAIQTDDVRVSTTWENCQRPTVEGEAPNPEHEDNPDQKYGALVAVKSLIKFLTCHMFSNSTVASICANFCIIMYVYIGSVTDTGGIITFYIPARLDDAE
ncbi:Checkpoint protein hus1 [Schizosaccharomyces pombe 972h-] [Rhizoctonia solani]|uniref:Checkpoint protein n=1 Tax=Rhizoctonia solani TaxID=456999 RepID=A0A0K6FXA6_9AGAM|nr:Checkpoint protein hus1 [Schizosaccharomyces pombe 972h-] [Rhizoctonia solani]